LTEEGDFPTEGAGMNQSPGGPKHDMQATKNANSGERPAVAAPDLSGESRQPIRTVLRLALGGGLGGGFLGTFAGGLVGVIWGVAQGDLALGLDGAVWGSLLAACVGTVYGGLLGVYSGPEGP
jgi:hypothetical protein